MTHWIPNSESRARRSCGFVQEPTFCPGPVMVCAHLATLRSDRDRKKAIIM